MRRFIFALICSLFLTVPTLLADTAGDQIVGAYTTTRKGTSSKIKVTKLSNGKYRAQVVWIDNIKNADGTIRTDIHNKDKAKRSVRADQIVLINAVEYNAKDNCWENGEVYDPTSGKSYRAKLWFEGKKLNVRGFLGPFHDTSIWVKQ